MRRNVTLPRLALWLSASSGLVVAQSPITASLVALAPIEMRSVEVATGILSLESHPAGPLSSASVQAHGSSYECSLGPDGLGYVLEVEQAMYGSMPYNMSVFADLVLDVSGQVGQVVNVHVEIRGFGDSYVPWGVQAIEIDLGADGTFEIDSGCPCSKPNNRLDATHELTAAGLPIRILSQQGEPYTAMVYTLRIEVTPWSPLASPVHGDCGVHSIWRDPFDGYQISTNYQLAAETPLQAGPMVGLRAVGFGQFGSFVLASTGNLLPLTIPAPFAGSCDVLGDVFAIVPGVISYDPFPGITPVMACEWQLDVPQLPPGLSFHAQHVSAEAFVYTNPATTWFGWGASNVLRIDT